MKKTIYLLVLCFSFLSIHGIATASEKIYQGCYVPKIGYIETQSTSTITQQGTLYILLEREETPNDDEENIEEVLEIAGTIRGLIYATYHGSPILSHRVTNEQYTGLFVSLNDRLELDPTTFDCFDPSTGQPRIIGGIETFNPVMGAGVYSGLNRSLSKIYVTGTVNTCPDSDGYLTNNFEVIEDEGGLCFDQ